MAKRPTINLRPKSLAFDVFAHLSIQEAPEPPKQQAPVNRRPLRMDRTYWSQFEERA